MEPVPPLRPQRRPPLAPTQIAQSLTNTDFFGINVKDDILPQLKRDLGHFGLNPALMMARVTGVGHPNYRPISATKQGVTTIRIYCARCTTHCHATLAERDNIFRCAVIGVLSVVNLPLHYCNENGHPEGTKRATLTHLFPHPKECLTNSPDHMLKHMMSSCTVGSGFVKLPIDLHHVIGPTFENMLLCFQQLTKARIQVNQDNETGKKIATAFAQNDIRLFIQCDDPNSSDPVQQSINRHYGLDNDEFQRDLELTMRRVTLFLANHLNIADELNFSTTHSRENIVPPNEERRLHPAIERSDTHHLSDKKPSMLICGFARTGLEPVDQAPHSDFGTSNDGLEIQNNPRLTTSFKPFTVIVPLLQSRKIVMYQERNGSIYKNVLETKPGEIMILDAGCIHGGYTYKDPTPRWERLPHVYPALHIYFPSSRHITDTRDLTISSHHIMNFAQLSDYIPNVHQQNRLDEARTHVTQLLRILPHLQHEQLDEEQRRRLESSLEGFLHD